MKAGRELDALIAEKVFGRRVEWRKGVPMWIGKDLPGTPWILEDGLFGHTVEHYSTVIRWAWEVVDEMHRKGFFWWIASHEDGGMSAHVRRTINSHTIGSGYNASDVAHSVCLAALGALDIPGFTHPSEEHNRRAEL